MKLLVKTTYPCLIKTDKDACELEENDTLEVEDEQFLFVYPQNGSIPFYIDTKNQNENQFVSIIKHKDQTIFLLEKTSSLTIQTKQQLNFSGKNCDVSISNNEICFETPSQKLTYKCLHNCKNHKVFKHLNYACVQFDTDFYAYNTNKSKLLHFSGDELIFEGGILSITKKFNDSIDREKSCKFKLEDDLVKNEEIFSHDTSNNFGELVPYRVMESILAKDYVFAMDSLNDNLKNQLDAESLKQFFGNINRFFPLSTTEFICISNSGKNYVSFVVDKNKIADISIDNL